MITIKIKKALQSTNGVTLVELVVGMLIFAIITTAVLATLVPTLRAYTEASELAEVNGILDSVSGEVTKYLNQATAAPTIDTSGTSITIPINVGTVTYQMNGTVFERGIGQGTAAPTFAAFLRPGYYRNKSVNVTYAQPDTNKFVYNITVEVIDSRDNSTYSTRDYTVRPLTLNQAPPKTSPNP